MEKLFNNKQGEQICRLYLQGQSSCKIAKKFNCSEDTIRRTLRKFNTEIRANKLFDKNQELKIIDLYETKKWSFRKIGKFVGCSSTPIRNIIKKYNIYIRNNGEANRKYFCDESYFNKIDTWEKAYILGWIISDGTIFKGGFSVSCAEKYISEFIKKTMQFTGPLFYNKYTNCWVLLISSQKIKIQLLKLGISSRKSFNPNFNILWDLIPKKYLSALILGIFDGDGCVSVTNRGRHTGLQFEIGCNNPELLKILQNKLIKNCQLNKTAVSKMKDKNCFRIRYGGNRQVYRVYTYLYGSAKFCLSRKKRIFEYVFKKYFNKYPLLEGRFEK